jgi:RimJ/RimL family protein N-acetyltransferase
MIENMRIILCNKKLEDAANDYSWKTDPELAGLDACPPLDMSFKEYLFLYISELQMSPVIKHEFSIETLNGVHIGNCAYYNIDRFRRETEVGIMLGNRQYWNQGYGTEAMILLVNHIFKSHNFKRVYLKTLECNIRAQHCFLKCGFNPCANKKLDGYTFIVMELPREKWQAINTESASAIKPNRS